MNQSIYTERENILPHHAEWLDGCGAKWVIGKTFSELQYEKVGFETLGGIWRFTAIPLDVCTHIPTGTEFCERVAAIMGLPNPIFEVGIRENRTTTEP